MTLKTRLEKLEQVSAPLAAPFLSIRIMPDGEEMTLDELAALPAQELLQMIRYELKRPCAPMTPEREREFERLKALPLNELKRLYANATGEKWE